MKSKTRRKRRRIKNKQHPSPKKRHKGARQRKAARKSKCTPTIDFQQWQTVVEVKDAVL